MYAACAFAGLLGVRVFQLGRYDLHDLIATSAAARHGVTMLLGDTVITTEILKGLGANTF